MQLKLIRQENLIIIEDLSNQAINSVSIFDMPMYLRELLFNEEQIEKMMIKFFEFARLIIDRDMVFVEKATPAKLMFKMTQEIDLGQELAEMVQNKYEELSKKI